MENEDLLNFDKGKRKQTKKGIKLKSPASTGSGCRLQQRSCLQLCRPGPREMLYDVGQAGSSACASRAPSRNDSERKSSCFICSQILHFTNIWICSFPPKCSFLKKCILWGFFIIFFFIFTPWLKTGKGQAVRLICPCSLGKGGSQDSTTHGKKEIQNNTEFAHLPCFCGHLTASFSQIQFYRQEISLTMAHATSIC